MLCAACGKRALRAGLRVCLSSYHKGNRMVSPRLFPTKHSTVHRTLNVCSDCNRAAQLATINNAVIVATDAGSTAEYAEMRSDQLALMAGRIPERREFKPW